MEIVPVGAMVVTVAFLIAGISRCAKREPAKLGNAPLTFAKPIEASCPSWLINAIIFSPNAMACSELYGILRAMSISAHPMTPRPIFRLA
ncbi:MAG: hypothetical protein ACD_87C00038G0002 [uncultured bacterium]|nr:MAG: hypothetical protein ACD_87C00038G0002 [uncultured bacterium]